MRLRLEMTCVSQRPAFSPLGRLVSLVTVSSPRTPVWLIFTHDGPGFIKACMWWPGKFGQHSTLKNKFLNVPHLKQL